LGYVLRDRKRNRVAERMLRSLSTGVDALRDRLRHALPASRGQRFYADYLLTVRGDTDSAANRQRRRELLASLLFSLFDYKDDRRVFTSEQRRIIWNSDEKKTCRICGKELRWTDYSADHILAHARGGRTNVKNAQMAHARCNRRKGSR